MAFNPLLDLFAAILGVSTTTRVAIVICPNNTSYEQFLENYRVRRAGTPAAHHAGATDGGSLHRH
jgi:hypothetical protein